MYIISVFFFPADILCITPKYSPWEKVKVSFSFFFFFLHRKTLSRISWTKFVEIKVHKIYWKVATNQVNYKVTTNSRLMILRLLIAGFWSFQRWTNSSSDIISLTRGSMSTFHFFSCWKCHKNSYLAQQQWQQLIEPS